MTSVIAGDRTYQASDLASRRRQFIDDARSSRARLRDTDGTSLVMLPEATLEFLNRLSDHLVAYLSLETALRRAREERRPTDFGAVAWAAPLDDEDLALLVEEFRDALAEAHARSDLGVLDELLHAWRATADFAADPDAMARLERHEPEEMVEVGQPVVSEDDA